MTSKTMVIVRGALLLALILLPLSVSAFGERGSAGILTDVEPGAAAVWIDYEPYAVNATTKLYDHKGQPITLDKLEQHVDQEVSYVIRERDSGETLVVLRVHVLIED